MKKAFLLLAAVIVFAGCETGAGGDTDAGGATRLKINNQSSFPLESVYWQGVLFFVDEGGNDGGDYYPSCLTKGNSVTHTVPVDSGYIYFSHGVKVGGITNIDARTRDFVVVEEKQTVEFTFTDNTVVVDVDTSNTGTLGSILSNNVYRGEEDRRAVYSVLMKE
jgi:hypothetical protein